MLLLDNFYSTLDALYDAGDALAVEKFLKQVIQIASNNQEQLDVFLAALNELGSFYRGRGYYDASSYAFSKAKSIMETHHETQGEPYATLLINLAGTKRLEKKLKDAELLYDQALSLLEKAGKTDSYAYLSGLNNLSNLYQETGRLVEAAAALEKVLKCLINKENTFQERAITCSNLGVIYSQLNQVEKAFRAYSTAKTNYSACPKEERVHYGAVLNGLGNLYAKLGNWELALQQFDEAAQSVKEFFGENEEYGIAYQNMGIICEKMGRKREAVSCYQKARSVYAALWGNKHPKVKQLDTLIEYLTGSEK